MMFINESTLIELHTSPMLSASELNRNLFCQANHKLKNLIGSQNQK